MKGVFCVPMVMVPLLAMPTIAQQPEGCTSYWTNPRTGQQECFGSNLTPTSPAPSRPGITPWPPEDGNQEPLSYLQLIRRAQYSYIRNTGRFAETVSQLDKAFRAGRLGTSVTEGLKPRQAFKTIPETTSGYSYQMKLVASLRRKGKTYLVYWVGATARLANRYSYVTISIDTFEPMGTSSLSGTCKSQAAKARIPANFVSTTSRDLEVIAQQAESFETGFTQMAERYANSSQADRDRMDTEGMREWQQLMERYTAPLKCPPGFREVKVS